MAIRLVRRALVTSVLVAALAVSVAACSRDDAKRAAPSTTTTKAKATTTTVAAGATTSTTTTVSATTTSSGTPTTTPPAGVNIPQFDVPSSVSCTRRGGTFSVPATWTTTANVLAVDYTIDGQAPGAQAGLSTSGRGDLGPIACDGQAHEITFYAYADSNSSTSVSRTVTGRPG